MLQDEKIKYIEKTVSESCDKSDHDAALYGRHSTNSDRYKERLEYFLDGIRFQRTGKTIMYGHIIDKAILEQDSEYQKYLELKKKFEKVLDN